MLCMTTTITTTTTTNDGDRGGATPDYYDNESADEQRRLGLGEILEDVSEDDVDVARSYASVRAVLGAVSKLGSLDIDSVNGLMADMREEMDEMALRLPVGEDAHDNDKLNGKFRRLKLECKANQRRP